MSSSRRYLVLDADTVFVRNTVFETGGREVLYCSDEYYRPYWTTYQKLLGPCRRFHMSFIAHQMLFVAEMVVELRKAIEKQCGAAWDRSIMNALDPDEISSFSEYETYGNFVWQTAPNSTEIRYWFNRRVNIPNDWNTDSSALVESLGKSARTVSVNVYLCD